MHTYCMKMLPKCNVKCIHFCPNLTGRSQLQIIIRQNIEYRSVDGPVQIFSCIVLALINPFSMLLCFLFCRSTLLYSTFLIMCDVQKL
jgi:hypothetical protein